MVSVFTPKVLTKPAWGNASGIGWQPMIPSSERA